MEQRGNTTPRLAGEMFIASLKLEKKNRKNLIF